MKIEDRRIDAHAWMTALGLAQWKVADLKALRRGARLMVFMAQETTDAGSDDPSLKSLSLALVQTRLAEVGFERVSGGYRFRAFWDIAGRRIDATGIFVLDGNTAVFRDDGSVIAERGFRLAARYGAWIARRHKAWGVLKTNNGGVNALWHGVAIYRDGRARIGLHAGPKGPHAGGAVVEIVSPWTVGVQEREAA